MLYRVRVSSAHLASPYASLHERGGWGLTSGGCCLSMRRHIFTRVWHTFAAVRSPPPANGSISRPSFCHAFRPGCAGAGAGLFLVLMPALTGAAGPSASCRRVLTGFPFGCSSLLHVAVAAACCLLLLLIAYCCCCCRLFPLMVPQAKVPYWLRTRAARFVRMQRYRLGERLRAQRKAQRELGIEPHISHVRIGQQKPIRGFLITRLLGSTDCFPNSCVKICQVFCCFKNEACSCGFPGRAAFRSWHLLSRHPQDRSTFDLWW